MHAGAYLRGRYTSYVSCLAFILALFAISPPAGAQNSDALINQFYELFDDRNFSAAIIVGHQAVSLEKSQFGADHPRYAQALGMLSMAYHAQSRFNEAVALLQAALQIFQQTLGDDHFLIANVYHNLAGLYKDMGRYDDAQRCGLRALALTVKADGANHPRAAETLTTLGNIYWDQWKNGLAEDAYKRAMEIYEGMTDQDETALAGVLNNLANTYEAEDKLDEAEALYKRSLTIWARAYGMLHPRVAEALMNISGLYLRKKAYDLAAKYSTRALEIAERISDPNSGLVGNSLYSLAIVDWLQENYAEAMPRLERALAIHQQLYGRVHPLIAVDLISLANVALSLQEHEKAAQYLQQAIDMYETVAPSDAHKAQAFNNMARIEASRGKAASALTWSRKATSIVLRHAQTQISNIVNARRFDQLSTLGKNQLGFFVNHVVNLAIASQEHSEPGAVLRSEAFEISQWVNISSADAAIRRMSTRFAAGDDKLASLIRESQDLSSFWRQRDKSLVEARSQPERQIDQVAIGAIGQQIADAERRLAEIDQQLREQFGEYANLFNAQPITIAATQALLRPDEALMQVLDVPSADRRPEQTFIWLVSKTDVRWIRIDLGPKALAERVRALRCGLDYEAWTDSVCSDVLKVAYTDLDRENGKPPPFDLVRAHELYKALFGQIEDLIKDKQLLIVASGPLAQLPFQVLVTEPPEASLPDSVAGYRDAAWLVYKHAITVMPSVASLKALRETAKESHASAAYIGFGNPLLDGDPVKNKEHAARAKTAREKRCDPTLRQRFAFLFGLRGGTGTIALDSGGLADTEQIRQQAPLPETVDELCDVARGLDVDPAAHLRLGEKATEAEVKRLSGDGTLANYRIVHFATHGAVAGQVTGTFEPGLILTPPQEASGTDDGYLTAPEIAGLKLDADWVILSACNTAAAGAQGAEALSGLARAFFYAGARSLLVSHWAVSSNATVKLIAQAIAEWKGTSKPGRAEALRRSMVKLIKDGQEAHPAFWAPFVLVGEGAQ